MKTVLFCGGLGTRIRDVSESIPKPMIPIGDKPILWHLMHYYSQFGHKDFVLCLGYKANVIKEFFLNWHNIGQRLWAVRRPRVMLALHFLESKGLIKTTRGRIVVVDRRPAPAGR